MPFPFFVRLLRTEAVIPNITARTSRTHENTGISVPGTVTGSGRRNSIPARPRLYPARYLKKSLPDIFCVLCTAEGSEKRQAPDTLVQKQRMYLYPGNTVCFCQMTGHQPGNLSLIYCICRNLHSQKAVRIFSEAFPVKKFPHTAIICAVRNPILAVSATCAKEIFRILQ